MCFSPIASFTAGTVLVIAGIFSLRQISSKSHLPFASIPLLFGIQQLIEGMVWLSLAWPSSLLFHNIVTYSFVMFSHVLWPIFVPIAVLLMENDPKRKKILRVISIMGAIAWLYLLACIIVGPVNSRILHESVAYDIPVTYAFPAFLLYITATCGSSLSSSSWKIRIFGTTMLLSFFVAHAFYEETFFSIWCFFAAVLSIIIYIHLRDLKALVAKIELI